MGPSGGGARLVQSDRMPSRKIYEAGISSVSGMGNFPNGASVYRALIEYIRDNPTDRVVVRVIGFMPESVFDHYSVLDEGLFIDVPEGGIAVARSRNIDVEDALDTFYPLRNGDGGDGAGAPGTQQELAVSRGGWQYPNLFIRAVSELVDHTFMQIETVQLIGLRADELGEEESDL